MTPERWQEIKGQLQRLLLLGPTEQIEFLDWLKARDPSLGTELETFVAPTQSEREFLDSVLPRVASAWHRVPEGKGGEPSTKTLSSSGPGLDVGARIGPYRVLHEIGRGGMGTVYLAARDDDEFRQRVALKVLGAGIPSEDLTRRFRTERQILAGLDHPHVAKLLDGGTTEQGIPYFAMEYIEGKAIDEYCDAHKLDVNERLTLFRKVCQAVHFAHQNLVVHRDLKPGNILVTPKGEPKLLDFGIAKLLNPELLGMNNDPTRIDVRLMTPEYSSPEQVRGESVTTASDVYSLGVLLYELLTGHRPYRLATRELSEITRVICQVAPGRPSTAIDVVEAVPGRSGGTRSLTPQVVSSLRDSSPQKLRRRLQGDLDNIVLMALRKEPQRRYTSVEQLSEDLRRHLEGLPVRARKDTLAYRSLKFWRRHRAAVATAALMVVGVAGFTAITVRERNRAQREAAKVKAVTRFLSETLGSANPVEGLGRDVTLLDALRHAQSSIDRVFSGSPETAAVVQTAIGVTYLYLGRYDEAESLLSAAAKIREDAPGVEPAELAESVYYLGALAQVKGDLESAEILFRRALALRIDSLGVEHPDTATGQNSLAVLLQYRNKFTEAESLFRSALRTRRKLFGEEHVDVAESLSDLGTLLEESGRFEEAESLYRQSLEMKKRLLGEEHPSVGETLANLAWLEGARGNLDEAILLMRQVLAMDQKQLGERHPDVATDYNDLALLLFDKGELADAEEYHRRGLELFRDVLGEEHHQVATSLQNLAVVLDARGFPDQAELRFQEALAMRRRVLGPEHPDVATTLSYLAGLLCEVGDQDRALPLFEEALSIFDSSLGAEHWRLANARSGLGECLTKLGRYSVAEGNLLVAWRALSGVEEHRKRAERTLRRLIDLYESWGRPEKASEYRLQLENRRGPEAYR